MMRNAIMLIFAMLYFSGLSLAQQSFPERWEGLWEGELEIWQGMDSIRAVPMSLEISPGDSSWNFVITYAPDSENPDRRAYSLIVENDSAGHYLIDEHNSIVLDAYLLDNCLYSEFSLMGTEVFSRICVADERMEYEMVSSQATPVRNSGGGVVGNDSIPKVDSYAVRTVTKAILSRKAANRHKGMRGAAP